MKTKYTFVNEWEVLANSEILQNTAGKKWIASRRKCNTLLNGLPNYARGV